MDFSNFSVNWEQGQVTHLYNGCQSWAFIGLSAVAGNLQSGCKSKADTKAAGRMDVSGRRSRKALMFKVSKQ